jgi:serine/threonine protein kinase
MVGDYRHNTLATKFENLSDKCIDLLHGLLAWNPDERYTINEALLHPFFVESPYPARPEEIRCLKYLAEL